MITESITRTKARLVTVKKQRNTQRRQRERNQTLAISLVGYTNAGKSSLFNALVKAKTYAADQLFATLDTTTRQLYLGANEDGRAVQVSLSDTVGFIRDLPHGLVDAFEATLQEACEADLLLHVIDAASPHHIEQIAQVQKVLKEIDAASIPQILIFNKLDAVADEERPAQLMGQFELEGVTVPRLYVSAKEGTSIKELRSMLLDWAQTIRSN